MVIFVEQNLFNKKKEEGVQPVKKALKRYLTRGECFYQAVTKLKSEGSKDLTPQIVFLTSNGEVPKKFAQSLLRPTKTQACKKCFVKWHFNKGYLASASNIRKKYRPHTMIELELYKNENDPMNMNYLKSPVYFFENF